MNLAQVFIERYESEDFKGDYLQVLHEQFHNNEADIVGRIYELFNVSNYETENYFDFSGYVSKKKCKNIFDFVGENFDEFVKDFSGYYVGCSSLGSVEFGEQEEQLCGIYNNQTKKDYGIKYLKKLFSDNGYYVSGEYAYYIIGGGIHVELCNMSKEINEILKETV